MSGRSHDGPAPQRPRLLGYRLRVVLLLAVVFGMPAAWMLFFAGGLGARLELPDDDQPGGAIVGVVVDDGGGPLAQIPVRTLLVPRGGRERPLSAERTDAGGRFAIDVPPLDGHYLVLVGGFQWQRAVRRVSLAAGEGELRLELRPACWVEVTLSRHDGFPIGQGGYFLTRRRRGFLGIGPAPEVVHGGFGKGRFERGGLTPGAWRLRIELDSGESLELELDLGPGKALVEVPPF